jgi:hypothetical protein
MNGYRLDDQGSVHGRDKDFAFSTTMFIPVLGLTSVNKRAVCRCQE